MAIRSGRSSSREPSSGFTPRCVVVEHRDDAVHDAGSGHALGEGYDSVDRAGRPEVEVEERE